MRTNDHLMVADKDNGRVAHQAARRNNMHLQGEWNQGDAYGGDGSIGSRQEYHLFRNLQRNGWPVCTS